MNIKEIKCEIIEKVSGIENGDRLYMIVLKKDGSLSKTNAGFNAMELMGLMSWNANDIARQFIGEIEPDVIERRVLVEDQRDSK